MRGLALIVAEHVILFAGPMGAGKTTAISSLSEIPVVDTEAANSEMDVVNKPTTTVALDYGEITVDDEKVRLYGVPGQQRFDFMWTILKERARGMVLLVNNDAAEPIASSLEHLGNFVELVTAGRAVIGVTKSDLSPEPSIRDYAEQLRRAYPGVVLPILTVDPRDETQMQTMLLTLIAIVESFDESTPLESTL